jgi:thioredoxin reductase
LCLDGARLDQRMRQRLDRNGINVQPSAVSALAHVAGMLHQVVFASGESVPMNALFFTTGQHLQSDLALQMGCAFNEHGSVETGTTCETNTPGVFVAGDASRDAQFVVVASAEGVKAALAINQAIQKEDLLP